MTGPDIKKPLSKQPLFLIREIGISLCDDKRAFRFDYMTAAGDYGYVTLNFSDEDYIIHIEELYDDLHNMFRTLKALQYGEIIADNAE